MRIISSTYTATPQIDGTYNVIEKHTFDTGGTDHIPYVAPADPDWDFQNVANVRAANINAELARREQEMLAANNFQAPISKRNFLALIPSSTRIAWRTAANSNAALADALAYLDAGEEVFKSNATIWLNGLVSAGAITSTVRDQILAAWTATYG